MNLVQNRQIPIETLMGALKNNLTYSIIGVGDDLVKYIEHINHTNEITQDTEPMEIDSIAPLSNYLADTFTNISSGSRAVKPAMSSSTFAKFL